MKVYVCDHVCAKTASAKSGLGDTLLVFSCFACMLFVQELGLFILWILRCF